MWKDLWNPGWPVSRLIRHNQVNISNPVQTILTKFAVTVARLPLTYFAFKNFSSPRVFNFYWYHAPTLHLQKPLSLKSFSIFLWEKPKPVECCNIFYAHKNTGVNDLLYNYLSLHQFFINFRLSVKRWQVCRFLSKGSSF